ncbi:MAG: hypothetical protein IEMM0002_1468 [bacterium]|nr:MAG: hypothetical protein IEMM0002_1468 [bacterium]
MRIVSMIIGISFLFISLMPVTQAYAGSDKHMKNPCEKMEYMKKHMEKKKLKMRMMKLMEEGMDMWLETVQLVKESAISSKIKKKAADLEKRLRANINEHKKIHKQMHSMHKEHGEKHMEKKHKSYNPCNPCAGM